MGTSEFQTEIDELKSWHAEYIPILFLPNLSESWDSTWELLTLLNVPRECVWINYDDGAGSCYLTNLEDAPPPEKVSFVGLYVTQIPNSGGIAAYLLTDQDVDCETCSGADDDCSVCGGTGIEWLELDDSSGVSKDPSVLTQYFLA